MSLVVGERLDIAWRVTVKWCVARKGVITVYCDGIRHISIAAFSPREILSMQAEIDIYTLPLSTIEADSSTDIMSTNAGHCMLCCYTQRLPDLASPQCSCPCSSRPWRATSAPRGWLLLPRGCYKLRRSNSRPSPAAACSCCLKSSRYGMVWYSIVIIVIVIVLLLYYYYCYHYYYYYYHHYHYYYYYCCCCFLRSCFHPTDQVDGNPHLSLKLSIVIHVLYCNSWSFDYVDSGCLSTTLLPSNEVQVMI